MKLGGPVLVTGGTGTQGGATARHLLAQGREVRVLTRDPAGPAAAALAEAGATAVAGDFDDPASIDAATEGVRAVFSVQMAAGRRERAQGLTLVDAARRAGVEQMVHTSVAGLGSFRKAPPGLEHWNNDYMTAKFDIEEAVREAGFRYSTFLRPATFMDNFIPPMVHALYPDLRAGQIATAMRADTTLRLIAADDIGAFAAAAFAQPDRFQRAEVELAVEELTIAEIAATLSRALGRSIQLLELTTEEALARGQFIGWVRTQEASAEATARGHRRPIDCAEIANYGIPTTSFSAWAASNRDKFVLD